MRKLFALLLIVMVMFTLSTHGLACGFEKMSKPYTLVDTPKTQARLNTIKMLTEQEIEYNMKISESGWRPWVVILTVAMGIALCVVHLYIKIWQTKNTERI